MTGEWRMEDVSRDDPVTLAMYANKHNLLHLKGWKHLKKVVKNTKFLARAINQVRLRNFWNKPVYTCGKQVPRDHCEAMQIDKRNGNSDWADSEKLEMSQLEECDSFMSLGKGAPIPKTHKKITCHFVYDVKASGKLSLIHI